MKKVFLFLSIILLCCACESDEARRLRIENQVNTITIKIYSNTPGALIKLPELGLIVKDHWEDNIKTKGNSIRVIMECENRNVLMTGEIYVNGKLKTRKEGNQYVIFGVNHIKYP